jgi:hypothetical protein
MEDDLPILPPGAVQRPEETGPTRLSLQELIAGSDRMDIILFLSTLDELMQSVSVHYAKLKKFAAHIQRDKYPPSIMIEQAMEAAVATNFAIQQVASLEQLFVADHPHLSTVYRVLANLVLVEVVMELTKVVSKKSPIAEEFTEKHAVEFLGDALECAFRNASDPQNRQGSLMQEFLDRWRISEERATSREPAAEMTEEAISRMFDSLSTESLPEDITVRQLFEAVDALAKIEVPLYAEQSCSFRQAFGRTGPKSHSWFPHLAYIGKNRSITHTIRLLQGLSNVIGPQQGLLIARKGMFGPNCGDRGTTVTRIQIDISFLL